MPDFVVLVNLTGCPLDSAKDNVLHNNIANVKIKDLIFMRQKFSWFILSFFIYCCVLVL